MLLLSIQSYAQSVIDGAQESPTTYISILFFLFEIFVRLRPTKKNLSILAKLSQLINFVIPNYSKEKAMDDTAKIIKKKFPY